MLSKPFDSLTRADIADLIDRQETEDRFLDYKERLPGHAIVDPRAKEDKNDEFRLDVIAFANSEGGHILFGVEECGDRKGYPKRIAGLDPATKLEGEIRRLHSLLDSSRIVPRISGVRIRELPGEPGEAPVIVVQVPKSLSGPHALYDGVSMRFYARNSKGNFQLDYWQVRDAFALSESLPERARQSHYDRFRDVSKDKPHSISKSHRFILIHLFPIGAFGRRTSVSIDPKLLKKKLDLLAPLMMGEQAGNLPADAHARFQYRWNIDGPFLFAPLESTRPDAFVQVYLRHGGVIEAVDSMILDPETHANGRPMDLVYTKVLEDCLISAVSRWMGAMRELMEATPPVLLMISLRGVEGFHIRNSKKPHDPIEIALRTRPQDYRIDRDEIHLPEILIDAGDAAPADFLRYAFDSLWQSAGWERCVNYDHGGNRLG